MMDTLQVWIEQISTEQLGDVWVAFSDRGLVTVEYRVSRGAFEAHVRRQKHCDISPATRSEQEVASDAACQIAEYLQGRRRVFEIQINWPILRSEFQRTALRAVAAIPYGETRTYGQIASEIGYPQAPRAMGRANATNPMPLVIPCHRVVGSDGQLHGYGGAGGLKTKQWLLDLEGAPMPQPPRSILAPPRI